MPPKRKSQYESALRRGKATSRAPIISGTRKLPNPARIGTTTRKIIVVPWIVKSASYESRRMKCSFGVASCARISSARIPPATKNARLVAMYMIPIRLWSTVVSQLEMRPRETTAETGSALAATTASRVEPLLQVVEHHLQLLVAPGRADSGHLVAPLPEEERHRLAVGEERALRDRRPDVALAGEPVARGADTLERLAADL